MCRYAILRILRRFIFLPECVPSGRGSAWLERLVRDQEVGGSNPLAPTKLLNELAVILVVTPTLL